MMKGRPEGLKEIGIMPLVWVAEAEEEGEEEDPQEPSSPWQKRRKKKHQPSNDLIFSTYIAIIH